MKGIILVLLTVFSVHGRCTNIPSLAWDFAPKTVLDYAKNTYGATPRQLAYVKWCIEHKRPGG